MPALPTLRPIGLNNWKPICRRWMHMKRHGALARGRLDDDLAVTVLIEEHVKDRWEKLDMSSNDTWHKEVRGDIAARVCEGLGSHGHSEARMRNSLGTTLLDFSSAAVQKAFED